MTVEGWFENLCNGALEDFRELVPNPNTRYRTWYKNAYGNWQRGSTGNMAYNATRLKIYKPTTSGDKIIHKAEIFIDEKIAPYVPYTNEPWISPRWLGHKNPNEGWFERSANSLATKIKQSVK